MKYSFSLHEKQKHEKTAEMPFPSHYTLGRRWWRSLTYTMLMTLFGITPRFIETPTLTSQMPGKSRVSTRSSILCANLASIVFVLSSDKLRLFVKVYCVVLISRACWNLADVEEACRFAPWNTFTLPLHAMKHPWSDFYWFVVMTLTILVRFVARLKKKQNVVRFTFLWQNW